MMMIVLFAITLIFAGISYKSSKYALMLLIAALPSYLLRFEIFGIPSTLLELLLLAFLIVWIGKNHKQLKGLFKLPLLLKLAITFFLIAGITGVVVAPDMQAALGVFKAYLLEPIIFFLVLRLELLNKRVSSDDLFKGLGISAIVLSLIAFTQKLTSLGIPAPWDIEMRATSIFDYPNALGLFLGPIIVIAILKLNKKKDLLIWLPAAVLSIRAITLSQSEAAIVSILATLILAGLICKKTRLWTALIAVLLTVVIILTPAIQSKLTLQDYSGGVRLSQWEETTTMLSDNWMFGAGLSGYPAALEPYHTATHYEIFQYPHNIVLNIWTELGVLGIIAFIILILAIQKTSLGTNIRSPHAIAFLALTQMTIHGLVDVPYFKNDLAILTWVLIAIIYASSRKKTHSKSI
jgi:putative inorganic carbon (hco3(-)) transporter